MNILFTQDGQISGIVVLAILLVIVLIVVLVSRARAAKQAEQQQEAALAAANAFPEAPAPAAAPARLARGSCGGVMLHDVPDRTAAMVMAIVADELQLPLNELRFISIQEVK